MDRLGSLRSPLGYVAAGIALWIIGTLISIVFPAFVAVAIVLITVGKLMAVIAGFFAVAYAIVLLIKALLG